MNENAKTLTYVGAAVAVLLVAWISRPAPIVDMFQSDEGQPFFPDFKDPRAAGTLEIMEYDEEMATLRSFEVAKVKGVWSIPSHENYPADAELQMAEAATSLMGLEKLGVVTDDPAEHEVHGVIDPDPKKLLAGATGVGKRVTMQDRSGKKLAQFVIGKEVKGQPDLHYVRVPGQDRVYRVKVDTDKLSTRFQDWIEKDLLKLNAFDVKRVVINDYSFDALNPEDQLDVRSMITLEYDNKESKWKLLEMQAAFEGNLEDVTLEEDEELDKQKLDDQKVSLDDLKIVNVHRKPKGLSAGLQADGGIKPDEETVESLLARGFFLARVSGGIGLFSSEGEVRCGMNDGVQYVLRFGGIAGRGTKDKGAKKDEAEKKPQADGDEEGDQPGENRFLFVMAEFNPDLIPPPELAPLPGEQQPEGESAGQEETGEANGADKAQPAAEGSGGPGPAEPQAGKPEPTEAGEPAEDATNQPPADKKPAADVKAERERIEKENKRKQDEYEAKVKKGQERVTELNARFADWYYVISDQTYQKIHLGRPDIVKKKSPETKDDAKGTDEGQPPEAGEPDDIDDDLNLEPFKEGLPE